MINVMLMKLFDGICYVAMVASYLMVLVDEK